MTPLRKRMIENLQLRGYSERSQEMYVRAVRQLSEHYKTSPDRITEEQLRDYFLYVKNERKWSRSASTIALCGIKFFFEHTIKRDWTTLKFVREPREKKLPVILSREEVFRILKNIRLLRYLVCLQSIYSCGLRLQEGTNLQVADIDSSRKLLHIHGKRKKDRYVPLPEPTLKILRIFWKIHHNPIYIFPAAGRGEHLLSEVTRPMPRCNVQSAFKAALKQSNIHKRASVHTLRHSYATHLLEAGVQQRNIQEYLGHNSAETTSIYTHLTQKAKHIAVQNLNSIMDDLPIDDINSKKR